VPDDENPFLNGFDLSSFAALPHPDQSWVFSFE